MKYRNIKNGAVIDIPSELKDKDWEPVKVPSPQKEEAEKPVKKRITKK